VRSQRDYPQATGYLTRFFRGIPEERIPNITQYKIAKYRGAYVCGLCSNFFFKAAQPGKELAFPAEEEQGTFMR
jgi:hypothetical protein